MEIVFLKLEPSEMDNFSIVCKSYREEKDQFHPTLLISGNQKETKSLAVKINVNGDLQTVKCRFHTLLQLGHRPYHYQINPPTGWISISLPEDSFCHDNEYFFTYGKSGNAKGCGSL